jgi:hypothetical protein
MVTLAIGLASMFVFLGLAMTWYAREQRRRAGETKEG